MTAMVSDLLRNDPTLGTAGIAVLVLLAWRLKEVRFGRLKIEFGGGDPNPPADDASKDARTGRQ